MDTTTHHSAFLFHQTAAQVRRSGQRGGRATARNRRLRAAVAAPQDEVAPVERPDEAASDAVQVYTQRLAEQFEELIRFAPAQWHVFNRYWID